MTKHSMLRKCSRNLFFGLLSLLILTHSAFAEDFDFKGLQFGVAEDTARAWAVTSGVTSWYCANEQSVPASRSCIAEGLTYANASTTKVLFQFSADRLELIEVLLSSKAFNLVTNALKERYGKAAYERKSKIKTRAGGTFDQFEAAWNVKGGHSVSIALYAEDIDHSLVKLISADGIKSLLNRPKQKADI